MSRPIINPHLLITFFLLTIISQGTVSLDSEAFLEQSSENPYSPIESKRGGGRNFQTFLDAKRGGGRAFQFSREPSLLDLSKRAGGRNFQQFGGEKRAGGRGFVQSIDDGAIFEDKRAGARGFYAPLADEKRGGARVFGFDEKRGGARGFYVPDKRGGARVFGYNEKRGGGRSFQLADVPDALNKRGGGRYFRSLNDFDIYGDSTRPLLLKRGGGRSFFGFLPDLGNSFYSPTRHFYSSYTKKAPYLQSPEFKRMEENERRTEPPYWGTLMTAEKRAGGRTFPIESEESKEK